MTQKDSGREWYRMTWEAIGRVVVPHDAGAHGALPAFAGITLEGIVGL